MDPVSSLVTGHAAGKLIDKVSSSFRTNVIERWTKRRANVFFEQFCREVELETDGVESDRLEDLLSDMLEDEQCTELLFDSYRRVSLSRSKEIGPRIIGIMTARLAIEGRLPCPDEESILDAAEQLYDDDLIQFAAFLSEYEKRANDESDERTTLNKYGTVKINWAQEQLDSNWNREFSVSLAPLDLEESLGPWAPKLANLRFISTDLTKKKWDYQEDSERHIDQDGSVREITWWIHISEKFFDFGRMIDRVDPDKTNAG